ncbi:MAG: MarC family protein [Moraxellaceae bacterium]|nr:MarC family protein [Moraxellaceae bacterium]
MSFEIIKILVAWVVLINPFACIATFLEHTHHDDAKNKRNVALTVGFSVFITILFFTLFGDLLLQFMGISISSFRIAGGVLLFLIAINMMNGGGNPNKPHPEDISPIVSHSKAAAVVPITIPMIMGPGGISTVIIYSADAQNYLQTLYILIAGLAISIFNVVILMVAGKVSRLLGQTGIDILSRVMGLLVAAVSVEIILAGLRGIEKFW